MEFIEHMLKKNNLYFQQQLFLSRKDKQISKIFLDLTKLNKVISMFYELKQLHNYTFFIKKFKYGNKSQLVVKDQNEISYNLSKLHAKFKCLECDCDVIKKGHCVIDLIRSGSLLCVNCHSSISHKTLEYNKNYKNSMLESYGVDSPIKSKQIKKKIETTTLLRYGAKQP